MTGARSCLRQLPSNVILGAETFSAFLERGKVSRGHHAGAVSRRTRYGQWSGNLHLGSIKEAGLVIALEGVGVGYRIRALVPYQKEHNRPMLTSSESQLPGLDVLHSHTLPIEKIAQTLGTVALIDTLTPALADKLEHVLGQLVHTVVDTLHPTIDNVDAIVLSIFNQLFHVAAESREVGGDGRNTHDGTLCGSVTPRLVVRGEDTHVGTADKVVVVHWEYWVAGAQELGMENNLDAIRRVVEELTPADLVEDGVFGVVDHVVGDNGWQVGSLHGKQTSTEQDLVLAGQQAGLIRRILTLGPLERALE